MILLDAGQRVPGERIMSGAKQRNPDVCCTGTGEAGTLLLRARTEREKDRDNRTVAGLTF
jgi:hypothetical protein